MNKKAKKIQQLILSIIIGALILPFTFARAQTPAVPVFEVNPLIVGIVGTAPGTILGNSLLITFATQDTAINTARLSAKETGLGFIGPNVPYTGVQLAAEAIATPSADRIGTVIIKNLIRSFTNSIVQWINSGFQGSPTFITDPDKFFMGVADRVAGNIFYGSGMVFFCESVSFDLRLASAFY